MDALHPLLRTQTSSHSWVLLATGNACAANVFCSRVLATFSPTEKRATHKVLAYFTNHCHLQTTTIEHHIYFHTGPSLLERYADRSLMDFEGHRWGARWIASEAKRAADGGGSPAQVVAAIQRALQVEWTHEDKAAARAVVSAASRAQTQGATAQAVADTAAEAAERLCRPDDRELRRVAARQAAALVQRAKDFSWSEDEVISKFQKFAAGKTMEEKGIILHVLEAALTARRGGPVNAEMAKAAQKFAAGVVQSIDLEEEKTKEETI